MNDEKYKMGMKRIFSLIILVLVLCCFSASGSIEQKEKKSRKEKQAVDQQKPAPNLSSLIDAKKYEITGDTEKAEACPTGRRL